MSLGWKNKFLKTSQLNEKNSKLFKEEIILYKEEVVNAEFVSMMKQGYIEMSEINLEIAQENEGEFADVNDYETWLCGVWFLNDDNGS